MNFRFTDSEKNRIDLYLDCERMRPDHDGVYDGVSADSIENALQELVGCDCVMCLAHVFRWLCTIQEISEYGGEEYVE